jgi:hypothetical protein
MFTVRRLAPVLALSAALLVPAVARADDAEFASAAKTGIVALAQREKQAQTALDAVKGRNGVPAARSALRGVRRSARSLARTLDGQEPSSADGRRAQRLLVEALRAEARGYGQLDAALARALKGDEAGGQRLVARAKRVIMAAAKKATAGFKLVATLGASGAA